MSMTVHIGTNKHFNIRMLYDDERITERRRNESVKEKVKDVRLSWKQYVTPTMAQLKDGENLFKDLCQNCWVYKVPF